MRRYPIDGLQDQILAMLERGMGPDSIALAVVKKLTPRERALLAHQYLLEVVDLLQDRKDRKIRREASRARTAELRTEHMGKLFSSIGAIIDRYTEEIKAEWTEELLSSTFGTSNGRVTWGEATAADHREHIEMIMGQIVGQAEDVAMHKKALQEMEFAGVGCLNELVKVASPS